MYRAKNLQLGCLDQPVDGWLNTGFSEVQRRCYREDRCPDLDRLDNRPDATLFMEAVK